MEVLNLATQEKQNEILSNFPISGGTDFFEGVYVSKTTAPSHYSNTVTSITGKGIVTAIWHLGGSSNATVRIQTDNGIIYQVNIGTDTAQSKLFLVPFKSNLLISCDIDGGNIGINHLLF